MGDKDSKTTEKEPMTDQPTPQQEKEPLVGEKEAASMLGVPISTLRRRRGEGTPVLPGQKIGGRYYYRPEDIHKKRSESSF